MLDDGIQIIVKFFVALTTQRKGVRPDEQDWKRETFTLSQQYLSGPQTPAVVSLLSSLEEDAPKKFERAATQFKKLHTMLKDAHEGADSGKRKIGKGVTASKKLLDISDKIAESLTTRDGIVHRYGAPYVILADGWKAYKGDFNVRIRCVPLDVSRRAEETIWRGKRSVTLVSATLSDMIPGDFTYISASLGLKPTATVMVNSPFDYAKQQLVYFSDLTRPPVDVPGAQFSVDELEKLLEASDGRSLVLFTARSELDFTAEELQRRGFPHEILVQEKSSNKQVLVEKFKEDKHSVLLATKSFFTGVDFPGETCSLVVLAKYPLPQYNALCRAQIEWWRKRGFHDWYDREGTLVFRQAIGRLIRTEKDHGVVAFLDQRIGMREKAANVCAMSPVTNNVDDVRKWLDVS
jgi:Rad3-related DNA helicase